MLSALKSAFRLKSYKYYNSKTIAFKTISYIYFVMLVVSVIVTICVI